MSTTAHTHENGEKFVTYLRVSTKRQGASGLGLEAQRHAVVEFAARKNGEILCEVVEIESGKKNDRKELQRAIDTAKKLNAVLLVAKLDRLSRSVSFVFALRDSGVKFVCADFPEFNTLTISIFAAMAQHERETISARTRAALAAKKARGEKLGTPRNLTHEAQKNGAQANKEKAALNENNRRAYEYAALLREKNLSLRAIGSRLNASGFKSARGGVWNVSAVKYLLDKRQAA